MVLIDVRERVASINTMVSSLVFTVQKVQAFQNIERNVIVRTYGHVNA